MGLGTALAVLIAGGAKGYRAGQELQRRLAEAERRMRIEEEQLSLQRQETQGKLGLYGAQTEEAKAQTEGTRFKTSEEQRQSRRLQSPLPSRLAIGRLPINTYEDLGSAKDYMDFLAAQNKTDVERLGITERISHPEAFSGSRRQYLDPEDQAFLDYLERYNTPPSEYELLQPGGIDVALAKRRMFIEDMIRKSNRPKLRALLLGDTTSTGGNRFRGR